MGKHLDSTFSILNSGRRGDAPRDAFLTLRVVQEPLLASNLASILATITELHAKCVLIKQGRFADVANLIQTHSLHDMASLAPLPVVSISQNSPVKIVLNVGEQVGQALASIIDAIVQVPYRLEAARLENQTRQADLRIRQEHARELAQQRALSRQQQQLAMKRAEVELEKQFLELEEARLAFRTRRIDVAWHQAQLAVEQLEPNAAEPVKEMFARMLLPDILQLGNADGLTMESFSPDRPA